MVDISCAKRRVHPVSPFRYSDVCRVRVVLAICFDESQVRCPEHKLILCLTKAGV